MTIRHSHREAIIIAMHCLYLALQLHKCKDISQGLATAARASLATSRSLSASHKTRGHGPTVIEQSPLELVVSTIWGRAILMTGARVIRSRYKIVYNFAWERNTNFSCIWNLFYCGHTMCDVSRTRQGGGGSAPAAAVATKDPTIKQCQQVWPNGYGLEESSQLWKQHAHNLCNDPAARACAAAVLC